MRKLTILALGLVLLAGLVGCQQPPSQPPSQPQAQPRTQAQPQGQPRPAKAPSPPAAKAAEKITIAVIPKGSTHEFWKSIHAGSIKAARELGNVEINWKGPMMEDDREAQIKVVEDFIARGVSGMVLAPLDEVALRPPVKAAKDAGIPVVIIDSPLQSEDFVALVATDNFKGGKMAGEYLCKLMGGQGNAVMLRLHVGSASTIAREEGWLEAMKACPGVKVLSSNQYGGATMETAYSTAENMLAPYKKADGSIDVQGIFSSNESTTFGMLRALQGNGWAGKVHFVGFDSSPKLIEGLEKGEIDGLILQNPFMMGYLGVKTVVASLNQQPVEKKVDTGETLVTRDNMNQPEIKELLSPDLKKWLDAE